MHDAARIWIRLAVAKWGLHDARSVLDLGGRIAWKPAGTIHDLFYADVRVLDAAPGPGVDIVADAATWQPDALYDVVLCTEVFEHTPQWRDIIDTAYEALRPAGMFLATCASRDRPPHSALTGGELEPGEYYANIATIDLYHALKRFNYFHVEEADGWFGNDDLYCWAIR